MHTTVTESLDRAAEFRRLGIRAAPALGANRSEHRSKYGLGHAETLSADLHFVPPADVPAAVFESLVGAAGDYPDGSWSYDGPEDEDEGFEDYGHFEDDDPADSMPEAMPSNVYAPVALEAVFDRTYFYSQDGPADGASLQSHALRWMTSPCALDGVVTDGTSIPAGQEPCYSLANSDGTTYVCPLLKICPTHRASQDLLEAEVWVVNPASFIHSRAPGYEGAPDVRMLEAVYRRSDLLIIDEADRVQVQWDRKYAPTDDLVGHREALIDWLQTVVRERIADSGRALMRRPLHRALSVHSSEVDRHCNWLVGLLLENPDLVDWVGHRPMTTASMYGYLAQELARPEDGADPDPVVQATLADNFQNFMSNPTSLVAGGDLAKLVNDTRYEDAGIADDLRQWLAMVVPTSHMERPDFPLLLRRLEFTVVLTAMDKRLDYLLRNWLWVAQDYGERGMLDQSPPTEYVDLIPESPLSNLLGYQYSERSGGVGGRASRDRGGILRYIQCYGLGRWLLHNFWRAYEHLDGVFGPHVLLASATSWAPGSPQFHLAAPVDAVMQQPADERAAIEERSHFAVHSVQGVSGAGIRVSGAQGQMREESVARLVRYLATSHGAGESPIERELRYWDEQGLRRKILVVVGSYAEVLAATHVLRENPLWRDRVVGLHPGTGDDVSLESHLIPRADIENLRRHRADVVVVPLLAVQRGFNILDELGGALLGSAFFLVRPVPVPTDQGQHVVAINSWAMHLLQQNGGMLPASGRDTGTVVVAGAPASAALSGSALTQPVLTMRYQAYQDWFRRVSNTGGLSGMAPGPLRELMWDQFVVVWQTIGRLVRRGRPTRIFFLDDAFHPEKGVSMIGEWVRMLGEYLESGSTKPSLERELAEALYGPAYRALSRALRETSRTVGGRARAAGTSGEGIRGRRATATGRTGR
jgi:hypothetical protein